MDDEGEALVGCRFHGERAHSDPLQRGELVHPVAPRRDMVQQNGAELVVALAQAVEPGLEGRQREVFRAEDREAGAAAADEVLPEDLSRIRRPGEERREGPAAVRGVEVVHEPQRRGVGRVPAAGVFDATELEVRQPSTVVADGGSSDEQKQEKKRCGHGWG